MEANRTNMELKGSSNRVKTELKIILKWYHFFNIFLDRNIVGTANLPLTK